MTYLFIGCFFFVMLWTLIRNSDLFSPVRLYVLVYSVLLAVNSLNLSALQKSWSPTTHIMFWGASGMFIAGGIAIMILNNIQNAGNFISPAEMKKQLDDDAGIMDWDWFYRVWSWCCAIFFLTFAYGVIRTGNVPIFAESPDQARLEFVANLINGIGWFFGPLSLMLAAELILFSRVEGLKRLMIFIVSIVLLFFYLTLVTRLDLFRFAVFGLVLYHYGKKRLSAMQLSLLGVSGLIVFLIFFVVRMNSDVIGTMGEILEMRIPKQYMWFSGFYSYVACNFWNMDFAFTKYVDGLHAYPTSWGFELFRPFFFLMHLEYIMQSVYGFDGIFNESITMVKGLNTSIYPWHFYKDFGTIGVFSLPLLFSVLLSVFYGNTCNKPSLFRISLWGIFAGMIIFSFTAVLWSFWFTYMNIIVLFIAHRKIRL